MSSRRDSKCCLVKSPVRLAHAMLGKAEILPVCGAAMAQRASERPGWRHERTLCKRGQVASCATPSNSWEVPSEFSGGPPTGSLPRAKPRDRSPLAYTPARNRRGPSRRSLTEAVSDIEVGLDKVRPLRPELRGGAICCFLPRRRGVG